MPTLSPSLSRVLLRRPASCHPLRSAYASSPARAVSLMVTQPTPLVAPPHRSADDRILYQRRSFASVVSPDKTQGKADSPSTSQSDNKQPPPLPDVEQSLDSIVPSSLFEATPDRPAPVRSMAPQLAREVVGLVLQQLRSGMDATTMQEAQRLQQEADVAVRSALQRASVDAGGLHELCVQLLKGSRDPRRTPITSRLFIIAFGADPMTMADPTAPSGGPDDALASQPIAGQGAWGINAAGYNWASMVLSGQASPPAGMHLLPRGSTEARELLKDQQAAAIRVYATLAMRGDAQGMLGMGRILLAGVRRTGQGAKEGQDAALMAKQEQEAARMHTRAVALWTRAGEKGVADAWFELGMLSLGQGQQNAEAAAKAETYFERGAKDDSSQCHHALAVMHTQRAMQDNKTPPSPERKESLDKSMEHFQAAARLGDGQSAHLVGMRYLLRDEMVEEIGLGSDQDGRSPHRVREQASERHAAVWGVGADDVEARSWFGRGADAGFMPSMMNLAGMLFEGRGHQEQQHSADTTAQDRITQENLLRLKDLRRAETLYAKVAAQAGVLAQQQKQQTPAGSTSDDAAPMSDEANMTAEMATFAQQALGTVQEAIKQIAGGAQLGEKK